MSERVVQLEKPGIWPKNVYGCSRFETDFEPPIFLRQGAGWESWLVPREACSPKLISNVAKEIKGKEKPPRRWGQMDWEAAESSPNPAVFGRPRAGVSAREIQNRLGREATPSSSQLFCPSSISAFWVWCVTCLFNSHISGLTEAISRPDLETWVHYPKTLLLKLDSTTGRDLGRVPPGDRVKTLCLQDGVGTKHLVSRRVYCGCQKWCSPTFQLFASQNTVGSYLEPHWGSVRPSHLFCGYVVRASDGCVTVPPSISLTCLWKASRHLFSSGKDACTILSGP